MIFKEIIHMNVNDIIWHVENFQNTWNGWNEFLGGLFDFFQKAPVQFGEAVRAISAASSK